MTDRSMNLFFKPNFNVGSMGFLKCSWIIRSGGKYFSKDFLSLLLIVFNAIIFQIEIQ